LVGRSVAIRKGLIADVVRRPIRAMTRVLKRDFPNLSRRAAQAITEVVKLYLADVHL
jgi:hypothetical protein